MAFFNARLLGSLLVLCFGLRTAYGQHEEVNAVIFWNRVLLQSVSDTRSGPTITARASAIVHTSMFDAWSAYNPHSTSVEAHAPERRPRQEWTETNREVASSYAAYRALVDLFPTEIKVLQVAARERCVDEANSTVDPSTPAGIGNLAAYAVLADRHHDGANQLGDLHPGSYSDYTGYQALNTPDAIVDPNHWQPLRVPTGSGEFNVQSFTTPQWGRVKSFAIGDPDNFLATQAPATFEHAPDEYVDQTLEILRLSARLTDRQKMIAEFWALGPGSVTPPGRWFEFAQFVSRRDHHTLDDDVELFFVLGNALLDSGIVCWNDKRFFDSERPITAIHYLFAGIPILAWGGPFLGPQLVDGGQWLPYQESTVVTPSFPEFMSGHSTFSAAAARILELWTGSGNFADSYEAKPGSSIIEPGLTPKSTVRLEWSTFQAAAEEAGFSRRIGGIHFKEGDLVGRETGRRVANIVWSKAQEYFQATR